MKGQFNGTMLTLARQRLGISQTDLARKSAIPQPLISKAEIGMIIPRAEQIRKLAEVLDLRESFFYITSPAYAALTPIYRKRATIPQKEINRIAAIGSITVAQISRIMRAADLENNCNIPFLQPEEYEGGSIAVARAARQFFGLPSGAVGNITSLMENHGAMIFLRNDFPGKIDGFTIYPEGFSFPYIFANATCQGERLRMTLAHELGHIFMHRFETPKCEDEAWDFAGEFLMPEDEFAEDIPSRITNIRAILPLKFKWKVSLKAIAMRLKKLGFISDRTYRYLMIQLSEYGRSEPYPIPTEKPELAKYLFEYCRNNLDYSTEELEETIGFNDIEFQRYYMEMPKRTIQDLKIRQ